MAGICVPEAQPCAPADNMQEELGFPDKKDPKKWSVSELNPEDARVVRQKQLLDDARYKPNIRMH